MIEGFYTHTGMKIIKKTRERELLYRASIAGFFLAVFQARRKVAKEKQAKQKQSDAEARDDLQEIMPSSAYL